MFPQLFRKLEPVLAWGAATLIRNLFPTWKLLTYAEDDATDPRVHRQGFIYPFWHEMIIPSAAIAGNIGIQVLISRSRDGDMIAHVAQRLGFHPVRGSTSKGAAGALRNMQRLAARANLALTPDGPRGPRRHFQPGGVYLASRTGQPIVPFGMAAAAAWRARSWDQMLIPKPFTTVAYYLGPPLHVPPGIEGGELEHYRLLAEQRMVEAHERAEQILRGEYICYERMNRAA